MQLWLLSQLLPVLLPWLLLMVMVTVQFDFSLLSLSVFFFVAIAIYLMRLRFQMPNLKSIANKNKPWLILVNYNCSKLEYKTVNMQKKQRLNKQCYLIFLPEQFLLLIWNLNSILASRYANQLDDCYFVLNYGASLIIKRRRKRRKRKR